VNVEVPRITSILCRDIQTPDSIGKMLKSNRSPTVGNRKR
jgi:hypothetical protein